MEILEAREALEEAETEEDVSNLQDEHRGASFLARLSRLGMPRAATP